MSIVNPLPEATPQSADVGLRTVTPVHHSKYYLQDGMIILVENTLYKVPRYMLVNESPVFADMFAMPATHPEGHTDAAPIQLLQVSTTDFERLLTVIYPLRFGTVTATTESWEEAEWTSVLHLAARWQMSEVRKLAIERLTACAVSVAKVTLGRLYDYPPWVREGFRNLCLRAEPLQMEEAARLSLQDILGVAVARERVRSEVLRSVCEDNWQETKYGMAFVCSTHYADGMQYSKNRKVHVILDEVFRLSDTADLNDLDGPATSHRPSVRSRATAISD